MPKQVLVESRNQTLTFPDDATQEEINQAVSEAFPREGQDVAFDLQKFQQQGGDVKDFIASIPDDDYIKLNNFRSDKKMTAAEMGGIALDAAGTLVKDVLKGAYAAGKTMVEAPAKGDNLATAKVLSSAARGVGAGTIDLAQLGLKLIDPTQRIPTYDEFAKQPVTDYGYAYGPAPSVTSRAATPEDYKTLVDSERKKELAALEMVDVADKLVQGASIEDVAKGARFVDAFTITGLAKGLAKGVGKGIAKKGFYESAAGLPAATKAAELTAKAAETAGNLGSTGVQAAAKTVETAVKVANAPINLARNLIKNETAQALVGAGLGYRQGDIEGAIAGTLGATVGLRAASATLKGIAAGADFIGSAAKVAKTGASRSGLFEKMAVDSGISQSARNIAKALLPTQPAFQFAGQVAKETAKDFIPAAGIGAGLGYMAGGEEGAAAGIGSALGVSALTGPIKASVSAVKTLAKAPTARGDANALGDIKTFVNAIPDEKSRIQYAQIMDQAIKVAGPERAADMLDALRLAEAHGATVVVGPKNSPNAFDIVGNTISVNPSRLNAGTVFHETTHQLVNVGIRASLLPELRNLYDGIRDADGNILKPGLYTEADWAAKAKELAESYKNNPQGYQMALDVASKLENPAGYSPEAIQAAKDFVLDEATASYAERLMGRSRPGAFNPDRLPMWHRNLLEQIDQRVLDKLSTELYSGQTNLNTPSKAFTDANGRPVRIPQLDVILRKALSGKYPKSGGAIPKQAAPKTVPIPKSPVDVAKFAQATFGATRDILGTDENGNPRLLTEKEHQAVAKADYDAAVQAFQQLSPDDQATVRVVNRKGEPVSITDKDSQIQITSATPAPVFERFLQVAKGRGMGNQQLATMRQLYASMVSPEGPTFDTVNNPVWKYSKRTGQMESTVRPPTRQEIYPLFIHVNSAGGFNVKYIDLSRLKQNAQKIMSDPKHNGIWPSMDAFMDDFKRSMRNLSTENAIPSAELLGNGNVKLGETKRDLIASAMNVTLPKRLDYINQPTIDPLSMITPKGKERRIGGSAFRDFRIERVTEITPTNERLKVVQENAYDKLVQRFQPDSFTPETLPNGEAWTNPEGYRILKKTGSKLYKVYDKDGTEIGVASSQDAAIKKAQDSFLKSEKKAENMRFQSDPVDVGILSEEKIEQLRKPTFYWRGTRNKGEIALAEKGQLRPSKNFVTNEIEKGVSVAETPATVFNYGYDYAYLVKGEDVGIGSDGEPVLNPKTIKVASSLLSPEKAFQKDSELRNENLGYRLRADFFDKFPTTWGNETVFKRHIDALAMYLNSKKMLSQVTDPFAKKIYQKHIDAWKPLLEEAGLLKLVEPTESVKTIKKAKDSFLKSENKDENVRFQPITPEQDAAYLNAVKSGDLETAQRMVDEAATGIGPFFHRSGAKDITEFYPWTNFGTEEQSANVDLTGRSDGSSKTYKVYLDISNPLRVEDQGMSASNVLEQAMEMRVISSKEYSNFPFNESDEIGRNYAINVLKSKGYDGIVYSNEWEGNGDSYIAFNPSQIKSADPVTYDDAGNVIPLSQRFNPVSNDIRFQPDPSMPSVLNGSNGTRIIKSNSGKFRVYSGTGALLGIRDTQQAAEKLATKP